MCCAPPWWYYNYNGSSCFFPKHQIHERMNKMNRTSFFSFLRSKQRTILDFKEWKNSPQYYHYDYCTYLYCICFDINHLIFLAWDTYYWLMSVAPTNYSFSWHTNLPVRRIFSSNQIVQKISFSLWSWASDLLFDQF